MCDYCEDLPIRYSGKEFKFDKHIDGRDNNLEMCLGWNPEYDSPYIIRLIGNHQDVQIRINFCPMCGRSLYNRG